mmetsp:Transcript_5014/g.10128  ORF Transcript_5014/g.10128 Transcript_5014/m.10128 type:complete len:126 (-) Transcript_5014:576-953(-)
MPISICWRKLAQKLRAVAARKCRLHQLIQDPPLLMDSCRQPRSSLLQGVKWTPKGAPNSDPHSLKREPSPQEASHQNVFSIPQRLSGGQFGERPGSGFPSPFSIQYHFNSTKHGDVVNVLICDIW